jgi:hypothetical protein
MAKINLGRGREDMAHDTVSAPTLIEQARRLRVSLQRAVADDGDFYINEEYRDQLLIESDRSLGDLLTALEQARVRLERVQTVVDQMGPFQDASSWVPDLEAALGTTTTSTRTE